MSDQYFYHLPKSGMIPDKQAQLLSRMFGNTDAETKCGIAVKFERLQKIEAWKADDSANPDLWCPYCFGQ